VLVSQADQQEFKQIYSAEHRILRVRLLMFLSVLFLGLMSYLSRDLIGMFETHVQSNGEPISTTEIVSLLIICQGFGWVFLVGMHLYGRCYVVRMFVCEAGDSVYETLGWATRISWFVSQDEEQACRFHRGKTRGIYNPQTDLTVMAVDAPYYTQRVKSRKLPFIVDDAGVFTR
jgi:hypothetical protein